MPGPEALGRSLSSKRKKIKNEANKKIPLINPGMQHLHLRRRCEKLLTVVLV